MYDNKDVLSTSLHLVITQTELCNLLAYKTGHHVMAIEIAYETVQQNPPTVVPILRFFILHDAQIERIWLLKNFRLVVYSQCGFVC